MPMILKTLDQIAREKQRGVLYVTFHKKESSFFEVTNEDDFDYEQCSKRKKFLKWLEENHIEFEECFGFSLGMMSMPYYGQIYLDVPFNVFNPQFQLLSQYLENPDGNSKDPDVPLYFLPLEMVMDIKHHDDPV